MKPFYLLLVAASLVVGTFSGCADNNSSAKTSKCGEGKCGAKPVHDNSDKACKENSI